MKLAIIANVLTPYRVHFHRRLQQEVPDLELHTLLTGGESPFPWRINTSDLKVVGSPPVNSRGSRSIGRIRSEWRQGGAILDYLSNNRIDVVVVHGYSDLVRLRVIGGCRGRSLPLMLRGDSNIRSDRGISFAKRLAKGAVIKLVTARCRAILVMGELGREFFETYGAAGVPMFTVPMDVDVGAFQHVEKQDIQDCYSQHGWDPGRNRLIYVGRLVPVKAVEDLLLSFARVALDRQNWDLVIAGVGPLEDKLRAMVPEQLRHRVSWLGFVDHDTLPAAYHACHLFVLPSVKEPWGVVVAEALAAGLPVITSDAVGAGQELLGGGKGGIVFPAGNVSALTEAIRYATSSVGWHVLASEVPSAFSLWRARADPVAGMVAALDSVSHTRVPRN